MLSVGLHVNENKDKGYVFASKIYEALKKAGVAVYADKKTAEKLSIEKILDYSKIDTVFILGGDGTILRVAADCALHNVKIIGINLGRLGFLTEAELPDIDAAVSNVISGEYYTEKRMMLLSEVHSDNKPPVLSAYALNDAVITKKNRSRLINIELKVNNHLADKFDGDGIILSTPTGSTGYSLSAGGPIICPKLECILSTPICAHTLYSRSIILRSDDIAEIRPHAGKDGAILSLDGQELYLLADGDSVKVTKSKYYAEFIRFKKRYFYSLLRSKFVKWHESKD